MKKIYGMIILIFCVLMNILLISAISVRDVSTDPSEVAQGEIIELSFNIKNNFDYEISDVSVSLDLSDVPFAPYESSSEEYKEEIEDDEKERFNFKLIVLPDAESGIYKIPFIISYKGENESIVSKEEIISITVNSAPELKIVLEENEALIKGREGQISVKVINSGLADVKFVYISPNTQKGINFITEKEQYIGDIDSNDFDLVKYNVYIDSDAPNLIKLPVIIKYRDSTNKKFVETKILSLRTYSTEKAQELGLISKPKTHLYIGLVISFCMYLIWRRYKQKKRVRR